MQQTFWDARWREGKIGFHKSEVNHALVAHWPRAPGADQAGAPSRVLVPLCGKTLDMTWLAAHGHEVVGVEFVESAAVDFFREQGLTAERDTHQGATRFRSGAISIIVADIFACSSLALQPFQWVYDRAALVALEPQRRSEYAAEIVASCAPEGGLLLLSFEHDMGSGPPFSVDESAVEEAYGPYFELRKVADQDVLAAEPRFRELGATYMREQCYLGHRRAAAA